MDTSEQGGREGPGFEESSMGQAHVGAASEEAADEEGSSPEPPHLPALPRRFFDAFFSPGRLVEALAENPKWGAAFLLTVVLISAQVAIMPTDVLLATQREAALNAGQTLPELSQRTLAIMRWVIPVGSLLSTSVMLFLFTGIYAVIFAFILGDEGRYRQYLAVVAHAWFVPAIVGLALTPLRISTENPQLTLNLGNFLFFLPRGYWLGVFSAVDLTQVWASLIIAQGAHVIDRRRSFGSAATILIVILFLMALAFGRFMPQAR